MGEPQVLRRLPRRREVIEALAPLGFEFAGGTTPERVVGFAPEAVIEVHGGPPSMVSLLFSASTDRESLVRSTLHVVTLARLLRLDYTPWLSRQLRRRGLDAPWRATRRLGDSRVVAEHLGRDAMLLTIEGPGNPA